MRTNIEIDDKLMQDAMRSGGLKTKQERNRRSGAQGFQSQRKILELFGKIEFDPAYDHKKMRESKIK